MSKTGETLAIVGTVLVTAVTIVAVPTFTLFCPEIFSKTIMMRTIDEPPKKVIVKKNNKAPKGTLCLDCDFPKENLWLQRPPIKPSYICFRDGNAHPLVYNRDDKSAIFPDDERKEHKVLWF